MRLLPFRRMFRDVAGVAGFLLQRCIKSWHFEQKRPSNDLNPSAELPQCTGFMRTSMGLP